jgi:hypothetical protein
MNFADLNDRFFDTALVLETYGNRWRAIGINIRGVIAVIFARRGVEGISIVSMRPASEKERTFYEANRR